MKVKKVFQTCLVLCGLLLSFGGITSLVVATLLDHDSDLRMTREAMSRTYGTQYWLGIPLIAFGGLLMLISPSLHKRKKMAVFNVCICIPLLTCCLVGTVFHGTAYVFFHSMHQNRLYVEDYDYICTDGVTHESTVCQCIRGPSLSASSNVEFPVPCDQQKSLVGFHGVLFSLSAIAFALLLGILVIGVIFLLNFFKLQLAITTDASGQENEGFSHGGASRQSLGLHIDVQSSQYPSQTSLYSPDERPPSYESLITSFGVTSPSVTNDVTNGRDRQATVNRQARVRYRGQLSSRFSPRTNQQDSLSNEVSNSDENDHEVEAQATANVVDGGFISPVQRSQGDTVNGELNNANRPISENGRVIIVESSSPTHSVRHEPTASNEARFVQSSVEPVIETDRSIGDSSFQYSNGSTADEGTNSGLTPHRPLEQTVSSSSETNVYIDITQSLSHNPVTSPSDPAHVAVRYRGQEDSNSVNSLQRRSTIVRGQEDTTDEDVVNINLEEGTPEQTTSHLADSSNAVNPQESTEPTSGSSTNPDATNTDTESHTEQEMIPTQLDNESIPSESNDVNTLNLNSSPDGQRSEDTNSESSLEILSI